LKKVRSEFRRNPSLTQCSQTRYAGTENTSDYHNGLEFGMMLKRRKAGRLDGATAVGIGKSHKVDWLDREQAKARYRKVDPSNDASGSALPSNIESQAGPTTFSSAEQIQQSLTADSELHNRRDPFKAGRRQEDHDHRAERLLVMSNGGLETQDSNGECLPSLAAPNDDDIHTWQDKFGFPSDQLPNWRM
jgi:hypothetical protein